MPETNIESQPKPKSKSNPSPEAQRIRDNYINKVLKVETKNGRVFYGKLQILDDKGNLLLTECISQCSSAVSCPVNDSLLNLLDDKIKVESYINLEKVGKEEQQRLQRQFSINKYYIGAAMIRGNDIVKVEVQV